VTQIPSVSVVVLTGIRVGHRSDFGVATWWTYPVLARDLKSIPPRSNFDLLQYCFGKLSGNPGSGSSCPVFILENKIVSPRGKVVLSVIVGICVQRNYYYFPMTVLF
jgi:hypothetical protein